MTGLKLGLQLARTLETKPPLVLAPLVERLGLEVIRWRSQGRLREVVVDGVIGIDDSLSDPWVRWLTAHAISHHRPVAGLQKRKHVAELHASPWEVGMSYHHTRQPRMYPHTWLKPRCGIGSDCRSCGVKYSAANS